MSAPTPGTTPQSFPTARHFSKKFRPIARKTTLKAKLNKVSYTTLQEVTLTPVDQNNPRVAAGYGWYCPINNGAVTTPFDAFMNWGEGVASYSPQILVTQ